MSRILPRGVSRVNAPEVVDRAPEQSYAPGKQRRTAQVRATLMIQRPGPTIMETTVALLAPDQIQLYYLDGQTDLFALFAVRKCNTGDTVDVSTWFKDAKLAVVLWTTTAKRDALSAPASNIVTLSTTALSNDAGWLSVWGSRA